MRKLLLFITGIFAIGAFMSCSGDEPKMAGTDADSSVREQFSANTNLRTLEEAAAIVRANMGILGETGSRSGAVRSFSPSSAKMVVNYGKSRAQLPDTLMYVFNFDNDEGFAVVAADRRLEGLIAITEKGSYDPAVGTDNPGLQYYMTAAEENLQLRLDSIDGITSNDTIGHGGLIPGAGGDVIVEGDNPGNSGGNNSGDDPITTLAQQKWEDDTFVIANDGPRLGYAELGQRYPEGMLCSNLTCGCTVTSMFLTMRYFGYPTQLYLDYDNNDGETIFIDWSDITKHHKSCYNEYTLSNDGCTVDRHLTIAKICRYLGYHIDASYGWGYDKYGNKYGVTSATLNKVKDVMRKLGFEVSSTKEYKEFDKLKSFAYVNAIALLSAEIQGNTGHMWIMDGIRYIKYVHTVYIKYDGDTDWQINGQNTHTDYYLHLNWGWNGTSNGWFNAGVFNPGHRAIPDTGTGVVNPDDYNDDYTIRTNLSVTTITL